MQDRLRELNKVFEDIREKKRKAPRMSKTLNVTQFFFNKIHVTIKCMKRTVIRIIS